MMTEKNVKAESNFESNTILERLLIYHPKPHLRGEKRMQKSKTRMRLSARQKYKPQTEIITDEKL